MLGFLVVKTLDLLVAHMYRHRYRLLSCYCRTAVVFGFVGTVQCLSYEWIIARAKQRVHNTRTVFCNVRESCFRDRWTFAVFSLFIIRETRLKNTGVPPVTRTTETIAELNEITSEIKTYREKKPVYILQREKKTPSERKTTITTRVKQHREMKGEFEGNGSADPGGVSTRVDRTARQRSRCRGLDEEEKRVKKEP